MLWNCKYYGIKYLDNDNGKRKVSKLSQSYSTKL